MRFAGVHIIEKGSLYHRIAVAGSLEEIDLVMVVINIIIIT